MYTGYTIFKGERYYLFLFYSRFLVTRIWLKCAILQEEKGEQKQVECLIHFLKKGNNTTLDMFIHALKASHQGHIVECLRPPNVPDPCPSGEYGGKGNDKSFLTGLRYVYSNSHVIEESHLVPPDDGDDKNSNTTARHSSTVTSPRKIFIMCMLDEEHINSIYAIMFPTDAELVPQVSADAVECADDKQRDELEEQHHQQKQIQYHKQQTQPTQLHFPTPQLHHQEEHGTPCQYTYLLRWSLIREL